ncbi:MAG: hypothetical protein ABI640_19385 [Gammaproteobacteria bacterium]
MEHLDKLAEEAVKDAIKALLASGKRPYSGSVPLEAQRMLREKGRNRVSQTDAEKRVNGAIDRLRIRKEIKAPRAPYNDWALIGHTPPKLGETTTGDGGA